MKLLRAFIEASGYEIEESETGESSSRRDILARKGLYTDAEMGYKVTKKGE